MNGPRTLARVLMTRAALLDKYGFRLSMDEVAEVMKIHPQTIYNWMSKGDFRIRTYKEGQRRFASYQAVAEYLEALDELARKKDGAS